MAITMKPGGWTNDYYGLSTDEMPTDNVPNGSLYYAFDTTSVYVFDAEHQEWILQASKSG